MAKCPHCGKELEFTVIPRKPRVVVSAARGAKITAKKTAVKAAAKKTLKPKTAPKRPLLKTPIF